MKIAITGHSAGIGQELAKIYEANGHEIVGLSRRNGYNIRSLPKVAGMIEPCDVFINNAQVGFTQTELLWEMWRRWQGQDKVIVNISTQMVLMQYAPKTEWDEYLVQKKTLELAQETMTYRSELPRLILERPGAIATQLGQAVPPYKDVNEYAGEVVDRLKDIING
jgi:NAD(P)-dependent dehydrogenase (short-subunit alcohol dehydrogenase family)